MTNPVSKQERFDILFGLALALSANTGANRIANALQILSALNPEDFNAVKMRVARFEQLTPELQKQRQTYLLERVRLRGIAGRLDENIHPSHLAEVLREESFAIQALILRYLPPETTAIVGEMLEISYLLPTYREKFNRQTAVLPGDEIIDVVRQKFLSNFTTLEDVYQPGALDRLSGKKVEQIIWLLGIRETAMACRGIKTKESLAVFLSSFSRENARKVVSEMSLLTSIAPRRVAQADKIIRETFLAIPEAEEMMVQVGLKLLAAALAGSEKVRWTYTKQKLPFSVAAELHEELENAKRMQENGDATEWETVMKEVEDLAAKILFGM